MSKNTERGEEFSKIRRAGELFEQNTESRGTIATKYKEQGNYLSKIRREETITTKYGEQGGYLIEI